MLSTLKDESYLYRINKVKGNPKFMVEFNNVSFNYKREERIILNDISFSVPRQ